MGALELAAEMRAASSVPGRLVLSESVAMCSPGLPLLSMGIGLLHSIPDYCTVCCGENTKSKEPGFVAWLAFFASINLRFNGNGTGEDNGTGNTLEPHATGTAKERHVHEG